MSSIISNNKFDLISSQAYWISPSGELIDVNSTHIAIVIADPPRFNLMNSDGIRLTVT